MPQINRAHSFLRRARRAARKRFSHKLSLREENESIFVAGWKIREALRKDRDKNGGYQLRRMMNFSWFRKAVRGMEDEEKLSFALKCYDRKSQHFPLAYPKV